MNKKCYYVSVTYLATVYAENEDDAMDVTVKLIEDGLIVPNDIEVDEAKEKYLYE